MPPPPYLYKILSIEDWKASQNQSSLHLPATDDHFIHLSKEEQLDKIINKYWSNQRQFIILKINTSKLKGRLLFEANPGGTNKYYHLYEGSIPLESIVDIKQIYG